MNAPKRFYSDPQVPDGRHGREALLTYLRRLLARCPTWVWTQTASAPMRDGFVNLWQAEVPLGDMTLEFDGVCPVSLGEGLIASNMVSFDRGHGGLIIGLGHPDSGSTAGLLSSHPGIRP